jgi:hypothetical protein
MEDGSQELYTYYIYKNNVYNTYPNYRTMEELEIIANRKLNQDFEQFCSFYKKKAWCLDDVKVRQHTFTPSEYDINYFIYYSASVKFTRTSLGRAMHETNIPAKVKNTARRKKIIEEFKKIHEK